MNVELPNNTNTENVYFTGDKQFTDISTHPGSYVTLQLSLRIFPYKGASSFKTITRNYKLMSYTGKVSVDLGAIVHPYFYKPKKLKEVFNFYDLKSGSNPIPLYKPLEVDVVLFENDYSTDENLDQKIFSNLKFVRGKSSEMMNLRNYKSIGRLNTYSLLSFPLYEESPVENPSQKCKFEVYDNQLFYNGVVVLKLLKISFDSTTDSITIVNAHDTTDVLLKKRRVSDIEVNGTTYITLQELSDVLTPLMYKFSSADEPESITSTPTPLRDANLMLYKNDHFLTSFSSFEKTLTTILWKDEKIKSGDVFYIENQSHLIDKKIAFSKGIQSYHLVWLDENYSLRIFEFTGRIEYKPIFEITQNTYVNEIGLEVVDAIEAIPGKHLLINSGQLMKNDVEIVKSIIANNKAWISFDHLKTFTSFYLKNTDVELKYTSEQTLFEFDLEIALNLEDREDHSQHEVGKTYDLIFHYEVDADNLNVDLSGCIDASISSINWGDNIENKEVTHKYLLPGIYQISITLSLISKIDFFNKNVTSIQKLPLSVNQIDCSSARMTSNSIKKLFQLLNAENQANGEIVFTDTNRSFFSKYVMVSLQQVPVILDEEAIAEAQKLIKKFWFVDYTYQKSPLTLTSRYSISDNYNKYYPSDHNLLLAAAKPYFLTNEEIQLDFSIYKSYGPDWQKYDWECYVYPRIDILESGVWTVKVKAEYPTRADAQILFNLGLLNEGSHTVRGVQQFKPQLVYEERIYDLLKTTLLEFDVISPESIYIRKNPETGWANNKLNTSSSTPYINFYPFGFISYCELGKKVGYEPAAIFSNTLSKEQLKSNTIFITEQAGNYIFSFKNYIVDFSELTSYLSSVVFYLAYVSPTNETILSNPSFIDTNGKIILNKDIVISDVPSGSYICPFISTDIKSGISQITGNWYINNFSRLIIKKL